MPVQLLANALLLLALFFLSWQTRLIVAEPLLNGGVWEYGKISFYLLEFVIVAAALLRGWPKLREAGFVSLLRFGVFLGAVFLSVGSSQALSVSVVAVTHLLIAGLLFLLVLDERLSKKTIAQAFVLGLLPGVILGIFQVVTGTSPALSWFGLASHVASDPGVSVVAVEGTRILRAYGFLPHPNVFGGYLAIGLLLSVWISKDERTIFWSAVSALLGVGLVLTFSRSAWLGVLFGAGVLLYHVWKTKDVRTWVRVSGAPVMAIVLTALCFFGAISTRTFSGGDAPLEQRSVSERVSGYQEAVQVFLQHPIVGSGIGAYTVALTQLRPNDPSWSYQPVHNTLLLLLSEVGLLGVIVSVWWGMSIVKPHTPLSPSQAPLGYALLLTLLPPFLFDHYLFSGWWGIVFLLFVLALASRFFLAEEKMDHSDAKGE